MFLKLFLALVVGTAGVTNIYFAGGRVLISMLPLALLFATFAWLVPIQQWSNALKFRLQDYTLLVFFSLSGLSAILYPNSKSQIYLAVYFFSYVILGMVLRNIMETKGNWNSLNKANLIAILVMSIFCIVEFSFEFLLNEPAAYIFDLQNYIPRPSPWNGQGYCGTIPRVFGLSNEPTYLGWYFNTLGVVALAFLWKEIKLESVAKTIVSTLIALAYFLTWSTSTWVFLIIGLLASFSISAFENGLPKTLAPLKNLKAKTVLVPLSIIIGYWGILSLGERQIWHEFPSCFGDLGQKVTLSKPQNEDNSLSTQIAEVQPKTLPSNEDQPLLTKPDQGQQNAPPKKKLLKKNFTRSRIWRDDSKAVLQKPWLGHGIGSLSSVGRASSLNLFLFIAYEQGIPAALVLLCYYIIIGWNMLKTTSPYKYVFLLTYVAGGLHLLTMTQHFYFNLWVLIGLFYLSENLTGHSKKGRYI